MDFAAQIRALAARLDADKDHVFNEEATKHCMVMPLLQILGYDIFNPKEIIPEYTAGYDIKKGEKVDYAIAFNGEPKILIEIKNVNSILQHKDAIQLYKYFSATKTIINIAILTNGIQYQFFSDLDNKNKMDDLPFFTLNLDKYIRDSDIKILQLFSKSKFNIDQIIIKALEIKYTSEIKEYLEKQIVVPEEEFIKFFMKKTKFQGPFHKKAIEQFSPIVSRAFRLYANQLAKKPPQPGESIITDPEIIKVEPPQRDMLHFRFWEQLLGYSKTITPLHSRITPGKDSWCGMGAGTSGLGYNYVIFKHQTRIELYIDKGNKEVNKEIFDRLVAAKAEIEQSFGGPLEWERKNEKRACRIKKDLSQGGYRDDEQNWPKIHEAMVDAMIRFHKTISPHIQYLRK